MNMPLSDEQKEILSGPLSTAHVKSRQGGRDKLRYVEAWHCIDVMNKVFGFAGWSSQIVRLEKIGETHLDGEGKNARYNITYLAEVLVEVSGAAYRDTGTGHGLNMRFGDAIESASKEAVSDAMKRSMRHLGYQFGLALYDKEFAHVIREETSETPANHGESSESAGVESTSEGQSSSSDAIDFAKMRMEAEIANKGKSGFTSTEKKKTGIASFIDACQDQKYRIGAQNYYNSLDKHGFKKSNEIFDTKSQRKVFDEFKICPTLTFSDHCFELFSSFEEHEGGHKAWTTWWESFGCQQAEVPDQFKKLSD